MPESSDVFAAIADPVRRDILRALAGGDPQRVVDLTAAMARTRRISRPAVSRHLRVLGEAGLVAGEDRGRERHYRLEVGPLDVVSGLVAELSGRRRPPIAAAALDALDTEVARTRRDHRARSTRHQEISSPTTEETA